MFCPLPWEAGENYNPYGKSETCSQGSLCDTVCTPLFIWTLNVVDFTTLAHSEQLLQEFDHLFQIPSPYVCTSYQRKNLENVTCQLTLGREFHVTAKDKPQVPEKNV